MTGYIVTVCGINCVSISCLCKSFEEAKLKAISVIEKEPDDYNTVVIVIADENGSESVTEIVRCDNGDRSKRGTKKLPNQINDKLSYEGSW